MFRKIILILVIATFLFSATSITVFADQSTGYGSCSIEGERYNSLDLHGYYLCSGSIWIWVNTTDLFLGTCTNGDLPASSLDEDGYYQCADSVWIWVNGEIPSQHPVRDTFPRGTNGIVMATIVVICFILVVALLIPSLDS